MSGTSPILPAGCGVASNTCLSPDASENAAWGWRDVIRWLTAAGIIGKRGKPASRRSQKADAVNARVTSLQREVAEADDELKHLHRPVEDGMTEMDEVLKDRLNTLKTDRDRAEAALERAKSHSSHAIQIDPALFEQFGRSPRLW